jgi:uncharacterized membrane protein
MQHPSAATPRGVVLPGMLIGIGLGGFVDGIVLHQVLQWHHMVSSETSVETVLGLERNTFWDGLFHAATWVAVTAGVALLWTRCRDLDRAPAARALWGWALVGWGAFNLVEGLVDHHVLGIHHVRDDVGAPIGWDLAFLACGLALVLVGYALQRSADTGARRPTRAGRPSRRAR